MSTESQTSPRVSVVVPVYNGERYLRSCIDSVLAQTYASWELVLVDNASTDNTAAIIAAAIRQDARVRSVRNVATVPVIENHNVAVGEMHPDSQYCKVLHADDEMLPECLEQMVAIADANPEVVMVGCWSQWGERLMGQISPCAETVFDGREIGRRALLGEVYPFISPSALLLRNTALASRTAFYAGSALHADVDMAYDLLCEGAYGIAQCVLVNVRNHEESVTASAARPMNTLLASNLQLLMKHGDRFMGASELNQRLEERLSRYYRVLSRCAVEGRDDAFWDFHRSAMADAGVPFESWRLWSAVASRFFRHPLGHASMLLRRLRPALSSPSQDHP